MDTIDPLETAAIELKEAYDLIDSELAYGRPDRKEALFLENHKEISRVDD